MSKPQETDKTETTDKAEKTDKKHKNDVLFRLSETLAARRNADPESS